MEIKYITNVRIPTSRAQGYAIMKMCSEFAKYGVKVDLCVPERANSKNKKDPFDFYKLERNFEIKKIPSSDFLSTTMKFGRVFYWIDTLSFLLSVKSRIKIDNTDILYTRDFLTILFFVKYKNIFLELHDIPKSKFLFKRLLKKPKMIFVLNNNLKQELVSLGIPESKISISPSGVEISDFDISISRENARKKLDLPQDRKIVVYTGHLYDWKGVSILAESAKLLPEIIFVFVGGVEPEIHKFTNKYKDFKNIIVRPFTERETVPIYLKSADVLVIPNSGKEKISSHYTSPLKLFEYMASNRPIVASDLVSIKEILNDQSCVFARPDDPESFKNSIEKVLSSKDLSDKIAEKARLDVEKYTWQNRVKDIHNIIKSSMYYVR